MLKDIHLKKDSNLVLTPGPFPIINFSKAIKIPAVKILKEYLKWDILYLIDISALGLIGGELTKLDYSVGCLGISHFYPQ